MGKATRCAPPPLLMMLFLTSRCFWICSSCKAVQVSIAADWINFESFRDAAPSMPTCGANFDGVGRQWYHDDGIRERIFDRKSTLVLPELGEPSPNQSQACCVMNKAFLVPIIKTLRIAKTLIVPNVDQIREQLEDLWVPHLAAKQRKNYKGKGKGRFPKLDPQLQLDAETIGHCHTDAKGIKTLLCFVRKQFLSDRIAKEAQLNSMCQQKFICRLSFYVTPL